LSIGITKEKGTNAYCQLGLPKRKVLMHIVNWDYQRERY